MTKEGRDANLDAIIEANEKGVESHAAIETEGAVSGVETEAIGEGTEAVDAGAEAVDAGAEAIGEGAEAIGEGAEAIGEGAEAVDQLLSEYLASSPEQQQDTLYRLLNDRLYWRIIYYMRRFPERLTSSRSTYSDRCVGGEELMAYMGHVEEDGYSSHWLESHRVPPLLDAQNYLFIINFQVELLLAQASDSPIARIYRHFALSHIEMEILATMVGIMREESLLRMMTVAWADYSVRLPTVSFLCQLMSDTREHYELCLEAFSEHGTLRRMRLINTERHAFFPHYTPILYAPIAVEQTVVNAYRGRGLGHDLPANMTLHQSGLLPRMLFVKSSTHEEIVYALETPSARLCLIGSRHAGRRTVLCSVAVHEKNSSVLEVDVFREFDRIASEDIEGHLASIMREALLDGSILLLRFDGAEEKTEFMQKLGEHSSQIRRMVDYYSGIIVLLINKMHPFFDDAFAKPVAIHIQEPSLEMASDVWTKELTPWTDAKTCERMSEVFSRNYALPVGSIVEVVRAAVDVQQQRGVEHIELQSHHILNEVRKSFRHQLGTLAEITVSDVPLSGVVLPAEAKAQVNEMLEYANNLHKVLDTWGFRQRSPYGNALSTLFIGPPGTGKTLLASALANELGKVLYRVDLSRIVDKYIGETEKNLSRIFDEAEKAQAIILFDEADSLFAKRTEVKSSNDRYANLEINFLLQKLESYDGMTILTTNLSHGIDDAFRRRLRFIIDFPMPDMPSRVELWKRMMPPNAPISDDIRWRWLARTFEMSGGYIRNAVLKASITASSLKQPISMDHLVKAASDEARSMGTLMRIDDDYDAYDGYDDFDL